MHELDGVFHREDVAVFVFVDVVDYRCQRGGFARSRGAGHQHHAARLIGDLSEHFGRFEIFQRQNFRRNGTKHAARATVLVERIDSKTREVGNLKGKIALEIFFVELTLTVVHDVIDHGMHVFVLQRRQVDAAHVAMHPYHRRQARRQMQVRSLILDHKGQQFSDVHYNFPE